MESTSNFRVGIQKAYDESKDTLSKRDARVVKRFLELSEASVARVHRRIRAIYIRRQRLSSDVGIDWTTIIEWIKENWITILKVILSVLPFLI